METSIAEQIERLRRMRKALNDMRAEINSNGPYAAQIVDVAYEYAGEADSGNKASATLLKLHNELHDHISAALDKTRQIGNITARARDAVEQADRQRQHATRRLKI